MEKRWTNNGVQYEFVVPPGQLQTSTFNDHNDSKFTITESGHVGDIPMPSVTSLWFHLRDFVPMPGIRVVASMTTNGFYGHDFKVALRVENTSTTNQTVRVMNCSWDAEWEISNPSIAFRGGICTKNVDYQFVIPPGSAYTNEADLCVAAPVPGSALTFRVGFTPIGGPGTSWSDELRVEELKADTWKRGTAIYRDLNHDGKIDWEVSGESWRFDGVDTYKVDTNFDGFYDVEYRAGGITGGLYGSKQIHERVPEINGEFVSVEKPVVGEMELNDSPRPAFLPYIPAR